MVICVDSGMARGNTSCCLPPGVSPFARGGKGNTINYFLLFIPMINCNTVSFAKRLDAVDAFINIISQYDICHDM